MQKLTALFITLEEAFVLKIVTPLSATLSSYWKREKTIGKNERREDETPTTFCIKRKSKVTS